MRYDKTPEITKAKKALLKFLTVNNLSPFKDYSKHPTLGAEFRGIMLRLNTARDKLRLLYPRSDYKNQLKFARMKKKRMEMKAAIKADQEKVKESRKAAKKAVKEEVVKAPKDKKLTKYEYPLVDGREMTSEEKRKYRVSMRKKSGKPVDDKPTHDKTKKSTTALKTKKSKSTKVKEED